jgi:signal transduction histidine kinase
MKPSIVGSVLRAIAGDGSSPAAGGRTDPERASTSGVQADRPVRFRHGAYGRNGAVTRASRPRGERSLALALDVTRAEQRERARIADVLHDDVQQVLAAARLHVSFGTPDAEAVALLDQALATTRRLAHDLGPNAHAASLDEALAEACRAFSRHHRVTVTFEAAEDSDGRPRTDDIVDSVTVAALRELLFNASRHAPGATVSVRLDRATAWARIRVWDDGPGFRAPEAGSDAEVTDPDPAATGSNGALPASVSARSALGLQSVRRRIEAVGGHVDAWSSADGARITLCVPLAPPSSDAP